jgi:hypothetical protein
MTNLNKYKMIKDLNYWKENCAENYMTTPISVLRYITELEKKIEVAISVTRCCEEFADGKCKPMVNADWTYLRCKCGKRFEPKG